MQSLFPSLFFFYSSLFSFLSLLTLGSSRPVAGFSFACGSNSSRYCMNPTRSERVSVRHVFPAFRLAGFATVWRF